MFLREGCTDQKRTDDGPRYTSREGKMPVIAVLSYKNEISIMSMMVKKDDLVDVIKYPECTRLVP